MLFEQATGLRGEELLPQVRQPGSEHRQLAFFLTGAILVAGVLGLSSGQAHTNVAPTMTVSATNAPAGLSAAVVRLEELRPVTEELPSERVAATARFPINFQLKTTVDTEKTEGPKLVTYKVREGDTLWDLSRNFQTDEGTIAALNQDIDPDLIQPGDELKIMANFQGVIHTVEEGDSLEGVAQDYGVTVDTIAKANQLTNVHEIRVGQALMLPGGRRTIRNTSVASRGGSARREASASYIWPLSGVITSEFGPRWGTSHPGLDIAAPTGTPAVAARSGKVVHSAWDGSYGLCVILDHGDGTRTRYAHASVLLVQVGDWVEQGSPVIRVGSTGYSTGPHLHFEVIIGGRPLNPRGYLP